MPTLTPLNLRRARVILPVTVSLAALAWWATRPEPIATVPGSPAAVVADLTIPPQALDRLAALGTTTNPPPAPEIDSADCAHCGEAGQPVPNPHLAAFQSALLRDRDSGGTSAPLSTTLASSLKDADLPAAVAALTHPDLAQAGRDLRHLLLERWTTLSPAAARDFVDRMSAGALRTEAVGTVARSWAETDLAGATQWARQQTEPSDREAGLLQIAYELARTQPTDALALGAELSPSTPRDEFLQLSAAQWASQAPEEALEWSQGVEDPVLRQRIQVEITTAWADQDPLKAATAAVETLPAGPRQNDAVVAVIQRWAQQEPETAGRWVAAFPPGELQLTAAQELVKLWYDTSPEAAGGWVNSLATGPLRDAAATTYAEKSLPAAPDVAAEWAETVENQDGRRSLQEHSAQLASDAHRPAP